MKLAGKTKLGENKKKKGEIKIGKKRKLKIFSKNNLVFKINNPEVNNNFFKC